MQHPFFAHRRTLIAASFAGLALLVFAPKGFGKIPDAASAAVREQSASPKAWEPSWASDREQSPTRSPATVSTAVREEIPDRSSPLPALATAAREYMPDRTGLATTPPLWGAQREVIPDTDTHVARVETPTGSDWTDELALGTGFFAALVMAGGMTFLVRHRRPVSTIR
jgi:hypothetical protein